MHCTCKKEKKKKGGIHTQWSNDIGNDVVLSTLLSESFCETNKGQFGGRVVGLTKVAEKTSGRGSVDDTTVLLLSEVRPSSAGALYKRVSD